MWLLSSDDAFDGRRLWLRPGKTYLFGRTSAEPGQLAISHNTISRKHLTITVSPVDAGHAHHVTSRAKVVIEDLATKTGTIVNGQKIKGSTYNVQSGSTEFLMGKCPSKFHLQWVPIVFTFSFTSKEMQTNPFDTLGQRFEQLDIKLQPEYNTELTSHVVSKKRNTAKGLQALINAKHIVTESFLDAVGQAAAPPENGTEPSPLEQDFDKHWPDAMLHLPAPGGEPVSHPDGTYAPDEGRKDVFEGYTFIFYDQTQYNNLLAPITNGSGKALIETVKAGESDINDFIRFVKNAAGEKGLGSFEDGSEGKGVVVVRYLPAKGSHVPWYAEFITAVSLRLDHRPIEQSEFLEAILIKDSSILRRPLEVESREPSQVSQDVVTRGQPSGNNAPSESQSVETSELPPRRARPRRPVKRRFAGFDDDADIDMEESVPAPAAPSATIATAVEEEDGLFVSQNAEVSQSHGTNSRASQKRQVQDDDLMDGMAPAAARFKRQRLERGDRFAEMTPEPDAENTPGPKSPKKKIKTEIDILKQAAKNREEEEARARAEKEDMANMPDAADLADIRRLNIVEEIEVRRPVTTRTREQDIADGRWDPRWNGMKNFKKFKRRGEATGRPPARVIVALTEVKNKEYGVGDDYWLEDEAASQNKKKKTQQSSFQETPVASIPQSTSRRAGFIISDDSDEDDAGDGHVRASATSQVNGTRSQSLRQTSQSQKRQKAPRKVLEVADSDDSDDDLKFRFGKRR